MKTRICAKCKIEKPLDEGFRLINKSSGVYFHSYCKLCDNEITKKYDKKRKLIVINHYSNGTNECKCCGENNIDFLCLDHINNGRGNPPDRRFIGNRLYSHLISKGFPDGFQVLCYNCNMSKGHRGKCPHSPNLDGRDEMYNLYV